MLFDRLQRLGSQAKQVLMFPSSMLLEDIEESDNLRLLIKAQDEYNVELVPITVQHRTTNDGEY